MIQQLRMKFIAIIMSVVTILLIVIFTSLYLSSVHNFKQQSINTIQTALRENYPPGNPPPGRRSGTSILVMDINQDGSVEVVRNRLQEIDDEEAAEILNMITFSDKSSGELSSQNLRYAMDVRDHKIMRYVFADTTLEKSSLRSQLVNSVIIGFLSFCAFFLAAWYLSAWLVKPVSKAWMEQQTFVANASHELKTPLTVILSNISLLNDSATIIGERDKERLLNIQLETRCMKQLVEQLLLLARPEDRKERSHHGSLDFSYLVQSAILRFEPVVFDLGKCVEYEIADGLWTVGEERELQHVLEVLLDNACKYSSECSTIRLRLYRASSKELILSVENHGISIARKDLSRIFHRFYRADPSRSQVKGYGLGLSIAQTIVSEHGGQIWAETDGISKNVFSLKLPVKNNKGK